MFVVALPLTYGDWAQYAQKEKSLDSKGVIRKDSTGFEDGEQWFQQLSNRLDLSLFSLFVPKKGMIAHVKVSLTQQNPSSLPTTTSKSDLLYA